LDKELIKWLKEFTKWLEENYEKEENLNLSLCELGIVWLYEYKKVDIYDLNKIINRG